MPVTVVTLCTTQDPFQGAGELYYLQVIRQLPFLLDGELMKARCQSYLDHVAEFAAQLLAADNVQDCDTMLSVPTTRHHLVRPYVDAARAMHPGINDITALLQRDADAGSTSGLSFAERQGRHHLSGPLPNMRRLLIIDDFIATGESAAHVIALMQPHTHEIPEVVIVAPLWVPSKDPKQRFLW